MRVWQVGTGDNPGGSTARQWWACLRGWVAPFSRINDESHDGFLIKVIVSSEAGQGTALSFGLGNQYAPEGSTLFGERFDFLSVIAANTSCWLGFQTSQRCYVIIMRSIYCGGMARRKCESVFAAHSQAPLATQPRFYRGS